MNEGIVSNNNGILPPNTFACRAKRIDNREDIIGFPITFNRRTFMVPLDIGDLSEEILPNGGQALHTCVYRIDPETVKYIE